MKSEREMIEEMNTVLQPNLGKIVISLFVMTILGSIASLVIVIPVFMAVGERLLSGTDLVPQLMLLPFLALAMAVVYILQFGFLVIMYRLFRGERAVIGHLFCGFRDWKRLAGAAALMVLLSLLSAVFTAVPLIAGIYAFPDFFAGLSLDQLVTGTTILYSAIYLIVTLRYLFVWLFLYDDVHMGAIAAYRNSRKLIKGSQIGFIRFCFRAGGRYLVIAAAAYVISLVISMVGSSAGSGQEVSRLSFIASITDFVYFVSAYLTLIRLYAAQIVWYRAAREAAVPGDPFAVSLPESAAAAIASSAGPAAEIAPASAAESAAAESAAGSDAACDAGGDDTGNADRTGTIGTGE